MKKWYQSKAVWFNLIVGALAIVAELQNIFPVSEHPKLYISILAVGNLILRVFFTTQPIGSDED